MRTLAIAALAVLAGANPSVAPGSALFLASGPLEICSSLTPSHCSDGSAPTSEHAAGPPRYRVDAEGIARALDGALWRDAPARLPQSVERLLRHFESQESGAALDAETLRAQLTGLCEENGAVHECTAPDTVRPWNQLLDAEQRAVLAALELPPIARDGRSPAVSVSPADSRGAGAFQPIEAFVQRLAGDSGSRPRIAFVTAAADDPYAAAGLYEALLRAAGAEPVWWPIDAALRSALFETRDCSALPRLRIERLGLPQREWIHPERIASQAQGCEQASAASLPDGAVGLLFADGDVLRLHQSLVHADGQPTPWLLAIRAASESGQIRVGGIGAGAAVLSDAPLATRGGSAWSLLRGASATQPAPAGCGRAGRCPDAEGESALHVEAAGGLGLAAGLVVEVQTSELARELRLLRLLQIGPARIGLGIDAGSAFWLQRDKDEAWRVESFGAEGGWILDAGLPDARCRIPNLFSVIAERIEPGQRARVGRDGLLSLDAGETPARRPIPPGLREPTQPGALRDAARGLAAVSDHQTLRGRVRGGKQAADVAVDRVSGQTWLRVGVSRGAPPFCPIAPRPPRRH